MCACVRVCAHAWRHTHRKWLACTFVHLTLHKHLIYMFSFTDHTLRVAKLFSMWHAHILENQHHSCMVKPALKSIIYIIYSNKFEYLFIFTSSLFRSHGNYFMFVNRFVNPLSPLWETVWDMLSAQATCSVRHSRSSLYASENSIWKRFSPTLFLATDQENVITRLYLFIYCGGSVCERMRACMNVCVWVCAGEWYVIVYVCVLTHKDISISSEY